MWITGIKSRSFYLWGVSLYGVFSGAGIGAANRLALSTDAAAPNEEPERREMACILKIPENRLPDNIDRFLNLCIEMGGDFCAASPALEGCMEQTLLTRAFDFTILFVLISGVI